MRKLFYVPIIHTLEEANMKRGLMLADQALALEADDEITEIVSRYWKEVDGELNDRIEDYKGVSVFQDGLIFDGKEAARKTKEINKERKNPNSTYLLELVGRGVTLQKTECEKMMMKFAECWDINTVNTLMEKRDKYMAKQIDQKLENIGILFVGSAHDVSKHLPDDIEVEFIYPFDVKSHVDEVYHRNFG